MSKCRRAESCSFFNNKMKAVPATAELFKKNYCEDDHSKCARNYLFAYLEKRDFSVDDKTEETITKLSDTLYPNQLEKVKKELPDSESE